MKILFIIGVFFVISSCVSKTGGSVVQSQNKLLNIKDGVISYRTIGSGPTIIFVAGGPGVCGPLYEETLSALADKNTLVFWNYAGCATSVVHRNLFSRRCLIYS